MVRLFGSEKKQELPKVVEKVESSPLESLDVPEPSRGDRVVVERVVDLSLINEKLNIIINLLQDEDDSL